MTATMLGRPGATSVTWGCQPNSRIRSSMSMAAGSSAVPAPGSWTVRMRTSCWVNSTTAHSSTGSRSSLAIGVLLGLTGRRPCVAVLDRGPGALLRQPLRRGRVRSPLGRERRAGPLRQVGGRASGQSLAQPRDGGEELAGVGVLRILEELLRLGDLDDLAGAHDGD